jgi:hypothetical protein
MLFSTRERRGHNRMHMAVGFTTRAISAMSFESACCTRRGIQHVVIKFVSELWQVLCG